MSGDGNARLVLFAFIALFLTGVVYLNVESSVSRRICLLHEISSVSFLLGLEMFGCSCKFQTLMTETYGAIYLSTSVVSVEVYTSVASHMRWPGRSSAESKYFVASGKPFAEH